ncbi:MAG: hypothetical protein LBK91_05470, partial [Synergistaceae bacterium]|nr:hypothetical protein [Synergistaceae bacterium]
MKRTNTKNVFIIFLLFLLTVLLFTPSCPASADQDFLSEYIQIRFLEDSRIPVPAANKILQTKDGYIWVASYNGLIRFDGQFSKIFERAGGSFPTNNIYTIFEDSRGFLWVGTNDYGLAVYKDGEFSFLGVNDGLPSLSVRSITEDASGNIYVSTVSGLIRLAGEHTVEQVKTKSGAPIQAVNIGVSLSGDLWCVLSDGGVLVLNDGRVRYDFKSGYFDGLRVETVFCSKQGRVYLGSSDNRVVVCESSAPDKWHVLETGNRNKIDGINEDSTGRLWICAGNGIGYFENDVFHPVDGAIVNNAFQNMIQDYEGNYWFSSSRNGILQLTKAKFKDMFFALQLPEHTVNAIVRYGDDFYVGTDDGIMIIGPEGNEIKNELTEKLKNIRIRCMLIEGENLWIATYQD